MKQTDDNDVTRRVTQRPARRTAISPALMALIIFLSLCLGGLVTYLIVNHGREKTSPKTPTVTATGTMPDSSSTPAETSVAKSSQPAPWHRLMPAKASCEVWLDPQYGNTYHPSNMLDGNPATAWAATLDEKLTPDGESFNGPTFEFKTPVEIKRIKIRNGYCKSDKSFYDNARVGEIKICAYTVNPKGRNGILLLWSGQLKDSRELQVLDVDETYDDGSRVTEVFTIMQCRDNSHDYYPGSKYADICLSDIEFWGR